MKKTFLLLTVAALLASVGTVGTASATKIKSITLDLSRGVPNAVMASYSRLVDDVINTNFPINSGWNDSDITWTKDRNIWVASGTVRLVDDDGPTVVIQSARFTNNGTVIEFSYTVIIPV